MKTSKISVHWLYILSILFYSGAIFSNELFQFKGAVVTSNALATEAGEKILAEGGNAYDAATTISAMLSVVEPFASGLGGGEDDDKANIISIGESDRMTLRFIKE